MYQFPKIPNWVNQLIKQASQLNSHGNLMQNAYIYVLILKITTIG